MLTLAFSTAVEKLLSSTSAAVALMIVWDRTLHWLVTRHLPVGGETSPDAHLVRCDEGLGRVELGRVGDVDQHAQPSLPDVLVDNLGRVDGCPVGKVDERAVVNLGVGLSDGSELLHEGHEVLRLDLVFEHLQMDELALADGGDHLQRLAPVRHDECTLLALRLPRIGLDLGRVHGVLVNVDEAGPEAVKTKLDAGELGLLLLVVPGEHRGRAHIAASPSLAAMKLGSSPDGRDGDGGQLREAAAEEGLGFGSGEMPVGVAAEDLVERCDVLAGEDAAPTRPLGVEDPALAGLGAHLPLGVVDEAGRDGELGADLLPCEGPSGDGKGDSDALLDVGDAGGGLGAGVGLYKRDGHRHKGTYLRLGADDLDVLEGGSLGDGDVVEDEGVEAAHAGGGLLVADHALIELGEKRQESAKLVWVRLNEHI